MANERRVRKVLNDIGEQVCPLSMIGGNPIACVRGCDPCIPEAIRKIASNSDYLECLNFPDDMFGTGSASMGLGEVARAIADVADAMEQRGQ